MGLAWGLFIAMAVIICPDPAFPAAELSDRHAKTVLKPRARNAARI